MDTFMLFFSFLFLLLPLLMLLTKSQKKCNPDLTKYETRIQ
jgi:hypothetical protein